MSIYDVFSGSKPFDKAEWAAQKQAQRKEAYELIDNTCLEMASGGDAFRSYLEVQGRLTAILSITPFWYPPRCRKLRSLRKKRRGKPTVSM